MTCKSCGAQIVDGAAICPLCGMNPQRALAAPDKPPESNRWSTGLCPRCYAMVPAAASFCAHCGAAVSNTPPFSPALKQVMMALGAMAATFLLFIGLMVLAVLATCGIRIF